MTNLKQNRPLSYSSLKAFSVTPNHLVSYWNKERTSSAAMVKGSLIHTLILEPETFGDVYAIGTEAGEVRTPIRNLLQLTRIRK